MQPIEKDSIILLGAGLSGSLLAAHLAQKGFKVDVFERRPDMRTVKLDAGKSINLALSVRGLYALEEIGLKEEVMEMVIPMPGRMIHTVEGELNFQPYSKDQSHAINSISRPGLNMKMMNLAESYEGVNFHFNQRAIGFDIDSGEVLMQNELTGEKFRVKGQTAIACDGAFSGVRSSLITTPRIDYSQDYLKHGYKELVIPAAADGSHRIEKKALHIWPRGEYMLIALPNLDGSFTVTLFFPYAGDYSFESIDTPEKVMDLFNTQFPDVVPHMPTLCDDFFANPTGSLVTVRCAPWSYKGMATLVGDAAHAVVPFFGQGMNAAFEDCTALMQAVGKHGPNWDRVFSTYQDSRISNSNAIADMAIENYIEMRDHTGDPVWQFRKQVEHKLEEKFPGKYVSRYEMVSFTRVPYRQAYELGEINQQVLDEVIGPAKELEEINWDQAATIVDRLLGETKVTN